jgi:glucose/mannose transport system substrate-binding protein
MASRLEMTHHVSRWAGAVLTMFAMSACGDSATITDAVTLDTLAYTAAQADALQPAIQAFRAAHPDTEVFVSYGLAEQLGFDQAMAEGRPPDVFQSRIGHDLSRWVSGSTSLLAPIDPAAFDLGPARIPAGLTGALTVGGQLYGVPFTIERDNTLYYNKKIFDENGLTPPRTLADFSTVAEAVKVKGIIPLAVGSSVAWSIGLIAWPWLLIEQAGSGYYADFFAGKKDPGDAEIKATLGKLAGVLAYSNYRVRSAGVAALLVADSGARDPEDPTALFWPGALDLVINGKAAMAIAGDFAKMYLQRRGWTPDVDFGEIPAPGTAGTFVFYGTAFGLPKAARRVADAIDLLRIFGSAETQAVFNAASGTIPACTDADRSRFDAMDGRRMDDLASATAIVPVFDTLAAREAVDALDEPLRAFAEDGNVDAAVAAMKKAYAAIKSP